MPPLAFDGALSCGAPHIFPAYPSPFSRDIYARAGAICSDATLSHGAHEEPLRYTASASHARASPRAYRDSHYRRGRRRDITLSYISRFSACFSMIVAR